MTTKMGVLMQVVDRLPRVQWVVPASEGPCSVVLGQHLQLHFSCLCGLKKWMTQSHIS